MRRIFGFALESLEAVVESSPDPRLRVLFEVRALEVLGLRPELRNCVRCGSEVTGPGPVAFHIGDGGVICGRCTAPEQTPLRVHLGTLRALEQAIRIPVAEFPRLHLAQQALTEAQHLVGRFQRHHVGIELRSERFLGDVLAPSSSA
jgi:DNA repair protein RecO (recombination protein O)